MPSLTRLTCLGPFPQFGLGFSALAGEVPSKTAWAAFPMEADRQSEDSGGFFLSGRPFFHFQGCFFRATAEAPACRGAGTRRRGRLSSRIKSLKSSKATMASRPCGVGMRLDIRGESKSTLKRVPCPLVSFSRFLWGKEKTTKYVEWLGE